MPTNQPTNQPKDQLWVLGADQPSNWSGVTLLLTPVPIRLAFNRFITVGLRKDGHGCLGYSVGWIELISVDWCGLGTTLWRRLVLWWSTWKTPRRWRAPLRHCGFLIKAARQRPSSVLIYLVLKAALAARDCFRLHQCKRDHYMLKILTYIQRWYAN